MGLSEIVAVDLEDVEEVPITHITKTMEAMAMDTEIVDLDPDPDQELNQDLDQGS